MLIPLLAVFVLSVAACSNDMDKFELSDSGTPPDNVVREAHIRRSENGKLQLLMDAPVIESYSHPERKTIYPKGVTARFFNGMDNPTAILSAHYAEQQESRNITFVRDSVVIVDLRTHDTVYLQELTWDANMHQIYSHQPVRSVNGPRVTLGDGFESDDNMQSPQIIHQRGTVEWRED